MADVLVKSKEAIVIILDVGRSMHHDCKQSPTYLTKAKTCVTMILQRKIFSESKDEVALVLCGTPATKNKLAKSSIGDTTCEYKHIVVAQGLKPTSWELLKTVSDIEGNEISADLIKSNAILVAMDLLQNAMNGKKFFSRRILFLSHFDETFSGDRIDIICEGLKSAKIDLNLIGPYSMTDESYLTNDDIIIGKTPLQIEAEAVVKQILKAVNGVSYSFEEAVPALVYYQKKTVQSLPWNANLDIGKNLTIPISAYIKVYETKPKPWKKAYVNKVNAKIEKETTYHLNDDDQTEVLKEDITSAFRYGTTLVPFSEEDKVNMEYHSGEKGMKVLGFTKEENVRRYYFIGDKTMYVFGQKNRELSGVILAPFIHALYETKMVAIVRYVYSPRSAPKIGFLSPRIKPDYECLSFVALPFLEDLQHFELAPLDSRAKHIPTGPQLAAIDDLITRMDLSTAAADDQGNRGEALKSKNTANPYLQRMHQCMQHRIFYYSALPDIPAHVHHIIDPNPQLTSIAKQAFKRIKQLFPLRDSSKQSPYQAGPDFNGYDQPCSSKTANLNNQVSEDDDEMEDDKRHEIGTVNPVKDFLYLVSRSHQSEWFEDVCKQMEKAIMKFFSDSMMCLYEDKILACLAAFRETSIKRMAPTLFNTFMKSWKGSLISRNPPLWHKIIQMKLSLIAPDETIYSDVSFQEVSEFNSLPVINIDDDDEDSELIAEL